MKGDPPRLTQTQVRQALDWQSPDPKGVAPREAQPREQHERREQRALKQWVDTQPWSALWVHIPNEREQRREAQRLQGEGVRRGVPDNFLFVRVEPYLGAVSELKKPGATRSAVSEMQRWWLLELERQGWAVGVHRGWVEAMEFFRDYTGGIYAPDEEAWWR